MGTPRFLGNFCLSNFMLPVEVAVCYHKKLANIYDPFLVSDVDTGNEYRNLTPKQEVSEEMKSYGNISSKFENEIAQSTG